MKGLKAAIAAFVLTFTVLAAAGAALTADFRIGRLLFGDTYAAVSLEEPLERQKQSSFVRWFPARLRVLLELPQTLVREIEKLLSSE